MIRARRRRVVLAAVLGGLAGVPLVAALAADKPVVVIVGERKQGMPAGEHDFPDGVLKIERLVKAAPAFSGAVTRAYPVGFPKNLAELDDASVVVLYLGPQTGPSGRYNPLQDPAIKAELDKLMAKGVGLVALHQSFTVPDKATAASFAEWLGAVRVGSDRTMQVAPVTVAARGHPIANGVSAFEYLDEFYPTISFGHSIKTTPVLTARVQTQYRDGKAVFDQKAEPKTLAWAGERPGGGRSVGYAGLHYLGALDDPNVRKTVLNSILWAAKGQVPAAGVTTTIPELGKDGRMPTAKVDGRKSLLTAEAVKAEPQPWGKLQWFASRALGNSTKMTVGHATILPGKENPVHWHPNTDEVLHVLKGQIMNRIGDQEFEMKAGDTAVIPEGVLHNARNIGTEDVVLAVSFNSADRYTIGEN